MLFFFFYNLPMGLDVCEGGVFASLLFLVFFFPFSRF